MKIINIVVGVATALILGSLIILGIRAFHPEPPQLDYAMFGKPIPYVETSCVKGDTDCIEKRDKYFKEQEAQQEVMNQKQKEWELTMKEYNRDIFVIANIIGILVFIGGFLVIFKTNVASQGVPIGMMLAGLWGIIYGYARGWWSTNDQLKFFVGLVIAALVIGGSTWLMDRYRKSHG
ncbi:MAG: hypothetical protein AAB903_03860 [Patescibacteria group bacterium]